MFTQNIDCVYLFWSKNKKNRYTPSNPSFSIYIKVGFKGVYISRTCFLDGGDIYFRVLKHSLRQNQNKCHNINSNTPHLYSQWSKNMLYKYCATIQFSCVTAHMLKKSNAIIKQTKAKNEKQKNKN